MKKHILNLVMLTSLIMASSSASAGILANSFLSSSGSDIKISGGGGGIKKVALVGSTCRAVCTRDDYYGPVVKLSSIDENVWDPQYSEAPDMAGCQETAIYACNHDLPCTSLVVIVSLEEDLQYGLPAVSGIFSYTCQP